MEVIKKGAEAELYRIMYNGRPAVLKRRIPKRYRVPELDEMIRKTRTRREARLLDRARRVGVHAPEVFSVDDKNMEIIMEFVRGQRVKEYLLETQDYGIMRRVGEIVATLHENCIVHGDLTTSNLILSGDDIYVLDFGLGVVSDSIEDKAVDLVCFEKSFIATHSGIAEEGWSAFREGYSRYGDAENVWRRVDQVKRRARYL